VTDIMGEISAASTEQSQGVSQVGDAVTQMDQVTQQNAALVEEMAAAAGSLSHHAQALVSAVEVFKLSADAPAAQAATAPRARPSPPVSPPAPRKLVAGVAPRKLAAPAPSVAKTTAKPPAPAAGATAKAASDDEWESF
jgi:hypothetical protein